MFKYSSPILKPILLDAGTTSGNQSCAQSIENYSNFIAEEVGRDPDLEPMLEIYLSDGYFSQTYSCDNTLSPNQIQDFSSTVGFENGGPPITVVS